MNKRFITITLLMISLLPLNLYAGSGKGKVTRIYAHTGDVIMFDVGQHLDKPACSTVGTQWALSLNSDAGKAMYSLLLSAAAQGQEVIVHGTNVCSAWGDRESPKFIYVNY